MKIPVPKRPSLAAVGIAGTLVLAGGSGFLASQALSQTAQNPVTTTTVTIPTGTGAQGPPGPPGPQGPAGPTGPAGLACPANFQEGVLEIDHPGGHVRIFTCIEKG